MKKLLCLFLLWGVSAQAATRMYFKSTGTPYINVRYGLGADWSDTTQGIRRQMNSSKQSSALTSFTVSSGTSVAKDSIIVVQFVSDTLAAQTLTGTFKGQVKGLESHTATNATVAFAVYLVGFDGALKKTLLNTKCSDGTTTPPELGASLINRQWQDQAEATSHTLPTTEIAFGDHLVVELGVHENTTSARTMDLEIGDNAANDLAEDNVDTDLDNAWCEFSQTLTFWSDDGLGSRRDSLRPTANGDYQNWDDASTGGCAATSSNWDRVNDTLTSDWLEMDASVTLCNQGTVVKTSHLVSYGSPPHSFYSLDTVRIRVRAKTTSGVGGDSIRVGIKVGADTIWGTRQALATNWTTWYEYASATQPNGDPWNINAVSESLQIAVEGKVTTALAEARNTEEVAIVVKTIDVPVLQPTPSCQVTTGDTLFPVGTGAANALSNGCGGAQSANWQCVNENPGTDGCESGSDTVWTASTTETIDYYKLGTRGHAPNNIPSAGDSSVRWGRLGNTNRIVDCISVTACCRKTQGATQNMEVRLGLRDTSGNVCWGPMFSTTGTTWATITSYFPDTLIGAVWGSTRWDSLSMLGLEVAIGLRVSNVNRNATCRNIYALVYAHDRDTSVAESTHLDMQVLACSSGVNEIVNRQSALYMSSQNRNRLWWGGISGATAPQWILTSSNDTGRTWYWLSGTSDGNNTDDFGANIPDTVTIDSTHGRGLSATGIYLFGDSTFHTDSLRIGGLASGVVDTAIIYLTKQRQQTAAELAARKDSIPLPRGIAIQYPAFFQLADTMWAFSGTKTTTGRLRWARSTDNGQTWPDSGYIQGPGCVRDQDTGTINITTGIRRLAVVRWSNGYPALFIVGWASSGHINKITFLKWHPGLSKLAADSGNLGAGRNWIDTLRILAFYRNQNTTTTDSLTVSNLSAPSNGGEMAASSVYAGTDADTMAHMAFIVTPRIIHATVTKAGVAKLDTVADITQNAGGAIYLSMASMNMKHIYLFWNYYKTISNIDTTYIFVSRLCLSNDHKWYGPRPVSWARGTNVQSRFPATSQYQYGNMVVCTFNETIRASSSTANWLANRIVKPFNPAAGGATPTPLRRRRLIIEKNYKTGELDEKDSLPDWAGLRLPDWDTEEK